MNLTLGKSTYIDKKKYTVTPLGLLPWATSILTETANKQSLEKWEQEVGKAVANSIVKAATARGINLDKNIEYFLKTGIILDCELTNQARSVIYEFDDHQWQEFVYHPAGFCGRFDYLGLNDDGYCLIDWKSSSRPKIDKFMIDPLLQVVANLKAAEYTMGITIPRGEVVVCIVDRELPQRFPISAEKTEPLWQKFLSRLDTYRSMFAEDF